MTPDTVIYHNLTRVEFTNLNTTVYTNESGRGRFHTCPSAFVRGETLAAIDTTGRLLRSGDDADWIDGQRAAVFVGQLETMNTRQGNSQIWNWGNVVLSLAGDLTMGAGHIARAAGAGPRVMSAVSTTNTISTYASNSMGAVDVANNVANAGIGGVWPAVRAGLGFVPILGTGLAISDAVRGSNYTPTFR